MPLLISLSIAACAGGTRISENPTGLPAELGPALARTVEGTGISEPEGEGRQPGCRPMFSGYPANSANGNHYVEGTARFGEWDPIEIHLPQEAPWIAGVTIEGGSLWAVVLADGTVLGVKARGDAQEQSPLAEGGPAGTPVALQAAGGRGTLLRSELPEVSSYTHPLQLPSGAVAGNRANGTLLFGSSSRVISLAANALPDARPLLYSGDQVLLATDPTDEYRHGVLGDAIEAGAMTLIEVSEPPTVVRRIRAPEGAVFEMIAPLLGDLDGDGLPDIVATSSDGESGARYLVYNGQGEQIGESEPIGRPQRWRHAIAVAPFGADGGLELAGVLTPHLGRVVEFHRLVGDRLVPTASVAGYSSHRLGSRNLDQSVAGDFDADGEVELLVPDAGMSKLAAIQRGHGGTAQEEWSLNLNGTLYSNLAVTCHDRGGLGLAVAVEGGRLKLWLPPGAGTDTAAEPEAQQ